MPTLSLPGVDESYVRAGMDASACHRPAPLLLPVPTPCNTESSASGWLLMAAPSGWRSSGLPGQQYIVSLSPHAAHTGCEALVQARGDEVSFAHPQMGG